MSQAQDCKRILLSGSQGCNVVYCEDCKVAEITVGAMSVRLEIEALHDLQTVLQQGLLKLSVMKATKVSPEFDYDQLNLH